MLTKSLLAIVLLGLAESVFANGEPGEEWADWRAAQQAAQSGNYSEAEKLLRAAPKESANYHYNLGTLAAHQGKWGHAVAHLEKANALRSHHSSTLHNLRIARRSLAQHGGPAESDLDRASNWLESLADQVPLNEIRAVLGMTGLLLIGVWARQYYRSRSLKATLLQPAGLIAAAALLITLTLYGAERTASSHPAAIALDATIVRSGPGTQFTELSRVDAGVKVRVLGPSEQDTQDTWLQVRYGPHEIGWITASTLLLL